MRLLDCNWGVTESVTRRVTAVHQKGKPLSLIHILLAFTLALGAVLFALAWRKVQDVEFAVLRKNAAFQHEMCIRDRIIPALVGDQGIAEPSGLDRIQAVLLTPHPVDLIQDVYKRQPLCRVNFR